MTLFFWYRWLSAKPLFSLIFWVQAACVLHLCCWGGRKRTWPMFLPTFFCFLLVQAVSVEAKLAIFYFWNTPGAEILFALLFWHDKKEYIYKYIFFLFFTIFFSFYFGPGGFQGSEVGHCFHFLSTFIAFHPLGSSPCRKQLTGT